MAKRKTSTGKKSAGRAPRAGGPGPRWVGKTRYARWNVLTKTHWLDKSLNWRERGDPKTKETVSWGVWRTRALAEGNMNKLAGARRSGSKPDRSKPKPIKLLPYGAEIVLAMDGNWDVRTPGYWLSNITGKWHERAAHTDSKGSFRTEDEAAVALAVAGKPPKEDKTALSEDPNRDVRCRVPGEGANDLPKMHLVRNPDWAVRAVELLERRVAALEKLAAYPRRAAR